MELVGKLYMDEKGYWIVNATERWMCPLEVGDCAQVLVGGKWLAVTMREDGCLAAASGRRFAPMQLMHVRVIEGEH